MTSSDGYQTSGERVIEGGRTTTCTLNEKHHAFFLLAICCCLLARASRAEDGAALKARLHRADAESAMDVGDLKPWHLRLAVQKYDIKGQTTTEQGTVEEWWAGPDAWKVTYSAGGHSMTELVNSSGKYVSKAEDWDPVDMRLLREKIVRPMPSATEIDESSPTLRKEKFGTVPLECVMLEQPIAGRTGAPLGLFPTYCFDPGKDSLRISYDFGSQSIIRNGVGHFQDRIVATEVTVQEMGVRTFSAKVTALQTIAADAVDLEKVDDLVSVPKHATQVSSAVIAGLIIEKAQPVYPEDAKRQHISGTVLLQAVIGRDGRVHSLKPIKVPDTQLTIAAIAAVRKWRYKPYLLGGVPVEIQTTITVNFNLGL